MVKLEEVVDEDLQKSQEGPLGGEDDWEDSDDDSSVASEASDDGPADETLIERISALRDIIPPSARASISHTFTSAYGYASTGLLWGGKALWVIGTSALLLGVPWALAYAEEQQYLEMEREMKMQQQTSELLTPGASTQPIQVPGAKPAL